MKKRGLSNLIQVVLIIILALILAGILAFMIHQGITRTGGTIDAEILVLQSEFSIISVVNEAGQYLDVFVKRESGSGTFPTVLVIDPEDKVVSRGYDGGDINIYQTAAVRFLPSDFQTAGVSEVARIEVYASAKDRNGNIVNSKDPKDIKILSEYLISPPEDCGNGVIETEEECDDGNTATGDGCNSYCDIEFGWYCSGEPSACNTQCGDGKLVASREGCDDGDTEPGDGCNATCSVEDGWDCAGINPSICDTICGDGLIRGDEVCDEGDNGCDYYPGCSDDCSEILECGNEETECDEECDDGQNGDDYDQCYDDCTFTYCGDNKIQKPNGEGEGGPGGTGNEDCDTTQLDGYTCLNLPGYSFIGGTLACDAQCIFDVSGCTASPTCGNGILEAGETCDDHNTIGCDGCAADCSHEDDICGDGILECEEICDDSNTDSCDGCAADCSRLDDICGDEIIECGETCDDGNSNPLDLCYGCALTYCGDGFEQHPNGVGEDGYPLGSGQEQCDNGLDNSDILPNHCRTTCRDPWCGDGVCDSGEMPLPSPPFFGSVIYQGGVSQGQSGSGTQGGQEATQSQDQQIADDDFNGGGGGCWQDCGEGPPNPDISYDWEIYFERDSYAFGGGTWSQ
jgi:cysteine-rich repeat protein